mgnify:FL=1
MSNKERFNLLVQGYLTTLEKSLAPSFVTPAGIIATVDKGEDISTSIVATAPEGREIVGYGITKGVLPMYTTMTSATGEIVGTGVQLWPRESFQPELEITPKPVWQTPENALLINANEMEEVSGVFIEATPAEGRTIISYTLIGGGMGWGFHLNSATGEISGRAAELWPFHPEVFLPGPPWETEEGTLGSFLLGDTVSIQLTATGANGYQIVEGALPWGLTLSPEGIISGVIDTEQEPGEFTIIVRAFGDQLAFWDAVFTIIVE